jgi:hypothetical protein
MKRGSSASPSSRSLVPPAACCRASDAAVAAPPGGRLRTFASEFCPERATAVKGDGEVCDGQLPCGPHKGHVQAQVKGETPGVRAARATAR